MSCGPLEFCLLFSYPERHHLAPALCSADSIFSATGVDSILPQSCSRLMLQLFHLLSTYLYPLYCSTLFRCLNSSCILWPYTPHPSLAHTFPKRIVDLPVVNHWCDNLYDPCRHKQIRHLCIFLHCCHQHWCQGHHRQHRSLRQHSSSLTCWLLSLLFLLQ